MRQPQKPQRFEGKDLPELSSKDKMKLLLVMMMLKSLRGNKALDINTDSLDPFAKGKKSP